MDCSLFLITSIGTLSCNLFKVVSNNCPHWFYSSFFKFNDIFYSWLLLIVNFFKQEFLASSRSFSNQYSTVVHVNNSIVKSWDHPFCSGFLLKKCFLSSVSVLKGNNLPCNVSRYRVAFNLYFAKTISLNISRHDQWFLENTEEIMQKMRLCLELFTTLLIHMLIHCSKQLKSLLWMVL